jgi:hypothetical protein
MMYRRSRRILLASALAVVLPPAFTVLAEAPLTKQDATRFETKLAAINKNALIPVSGQRTRSTQVTDVEVNSYLKYSAGSQIPVGIVQPTLNALGNGRVGGRALVDLDAVRKQKKRGWMDPLGYLSGMLPVTAVGTLTTENGVGRFTLESAEISGVTIPKGLLQELLTYYSRTKENPAGINMDDPFDLPARIREIRIAQGTATVIQ